MSARGVLVRSELASYLPLCTNAELETFLRLVAQECARRDVADTFRLFDMARAMERTRTFGPRTETSQ